MTPKNAPATALPWETSMVQTKGGALFDVCAAGGGDMIADVQGGGYEDAAYIAHAANAYPRMVDALRQIRDAEELSTGSFVCDFATLQSIAGSLLRALGEDA